MNSAAKPFLKWAGGKTQLLSDIENRFPYKKKDRFIYVEPFLGSGAVLFWILNEFPNVSSVIVNDINEDLINVYRVIKSDVGFLIEILGEYEAEYHSLEGFLDKKMEYYYQKRDAFNARISNLVELAALFIFLNKTCFNGLYRVNRKNEFNVPVGSYKRPSICNKNNLEIVHEKLQRVEILCGDFEQTLIHAGENSFFYFDPPYKPLSSTSSFNSYAKDEFNDEEQIRLQRFCALLDSLNTKWILSNSDVRSADEENVFFDELYSNYEISRVLAKRSINSNATKRGSLTELLITNMRAI